MKRRNFFHDVLLPFHFFRHFIPTTAMTPTDFVRLLPRRPNLPSPVHRQILHAGIGSIHASATAVAPRDTENVW